MSACSSWRSTPTSSRNSAKKCFRSVLIYVVSRCSMSSRAATEPARGSFKGRNLLVCHKSHFSYGETLFTLLAFAFKLTSLTLDLSLLLVDLLLLIIEFLVPTLYLIAC